MNKKGLEMESLMKLLLVLAAIIAALVLYKILHSSSENIFTTLIERMRGG